MTNQNYTPTSPEGQRSLIRLQHSPSLLCTCKRCRRVLKPSFIISWCPFSPWEHLPGSAEPSHGQDVGTPFPPISYLSLISWLFLVADKGFWRVPAAPGAAGTGWALGQNFSPSVPQNITQGLKQLPALLKWPLVGCPCIEVIAALTAAKLQLLIIYIKIDFFFLLWPPEFITWANAEINQGRMGDIIWRYQNIFKHVLGKKNTTLHKVKELEIFSVQCGRVWTRWASRIHISLHRCNYFLFFEEFNMERCSFFPVWMLSWETEFASPRGGKTKILGLDLCKKQETLRYYNFPIICCLKN